MSCRRFQLRPVEEHIPVKHLISLIFLVGILITSNTFGQNSVSTVKQIDAFAKTIDARTKGAKASKLIFADVSDYESNAAAKWQRFASEKALQRHRDKTEAYTIAYVWLDGGKVVSTNFTMFSPSGDWAKYVYSYFRPDGTLARVETDFRTFNGDFKVVSRRYFDAAGKQVGSSAKTLDLTTGKPKKAPDGVMGDDPKEIDYFMTASKLPFARLLATK
jgi:hypothetical protein